MENAQSKTPTEEAMWAGRSGERWLANAARLEASMRPIGDALLERADLSPGLRVLDVGCGAGAMSLVIADRIAPGGSVIGLDISPALVDEATRRAVASAHGEAAGFVLGDAASVALPASSFDRVVSRFGVMFFTDPYAAFGHLHAMLKPGGKLAFACWGPVEQNPWMGEPRRIIAAHADLPPLLPRTPGPFAFDPPDYPRDILARANFNHVDIAPWTGEIFIGGPGTSPESATDFILNSMNLAQRIADAPQHTRDTVRTELITRLEDFMTPDGVRMPASVWLATARA